MKLVLLALMTVVLAACSGESLSPERKACLERQAPKPIALSAIRLQPSMPIRKPKTLVPRQTTPTKAAMSA